MYILSIEIKDVWVTVLKCDDLSLCESTFASISSQNVCDCVILQKEDQTTPLKIHIKGLFY